MHRSRGGHWLCLDTEGCFAQRQPKFFERISPDGVKPALIFADGGSPIAVAADGNLYYVSGNEELTPGGLHLARNSPDGAVSFVATELNNFTGTHGITGLVAGPAGGLYVASPNAVFKLNTNGTYSTLANPIRLEGCDIDYPDGKTNNPLPYLRGLAVDEHGNVFAAGTACHCVVKIAADTAPVIVLKSERPWSPTGIATYRGAVYVLEYTHANEGSDRGWRPRVRRLASDGSVTTLLTVPAPQ